MSHETPRVAVLSLKRRCAGRRGMRGAESRFALALGATALLGGCASLLGADFDRPGAQDDADAATESGSPEAGTAIDSASPEAGTAIDSGSPEAGTGACAMTCMSPPPNACMDGKTQRAYLPQGSCTAGGACGYAHFDVLCTTSCEGGACTGDDPCNGITCLAPPAPTCINGTTLKTSSASGTCAGGKCSYTFTSTTCANGCNGGACTGEPCAGVTCTQPPGASCLNATTRRSYASPGTCSGGGTCAYAPVDTACANGCQGGACSGDPCAGVTCNDAPAATCLNATTRRSYALPGTCSGAGVCAYAPADAACTAAPANADPLCTGGACDFACRSGFMRSGAACVAAAPATWTTVARMGTARQMFGGALGADGRIYAVAGDGNGASLSTVEAYTPGSNTWAPVATLSIASGTLTAAAGTDGRIYAIGGGDTSSVEAYTPSTNTWAAAGSMLLDRYEHASAVGTDGRIYAIGGFRKGPSVPYILATMEVYTPGTNTWTAVASMPTPRVNLAAAAGADGRIYAIGGSGVGADSWLATVEVYTPSTNTWATVQSMLTPRSGAGAVAGADGRIYAIGGYDGTSELATVEAYTPSTDTWAAVPSMQFTHVDLAAVTGADGRIYAIGGGKNIVPMTTVEVYTP